LLSCQGNQITQLNLQFTENLFNHNLKKSFINDFRYGNWCGIDYGGFDDRGCK